MGLINRLRHRLRSRGSEAAATGRRALDREAARALRPGDEHYTAYVGPPTQYDFMGATQFRLLTALGLREQHDLLDFGCGSLRAGRLLIPYLLPGHYFGLDPNRWLIEDAIAHELGAGLVALKRPIFRHDDDFTAAGFGVRFDFILAQSIFSHAGADIVGRCLASFRETLKPGGLVLATFVLPGRVPNAVPEGEGWVYPECVWYELPRLIEMTEAAGLVGRPLPWSHPTQTWFAMAGRREDLPSEADDIHLGGRVLPRPAPSPET
ncbi:MAG: class I SAM-dependent methyltransferase [Devosia sp.]|nr:class I SAM-dependent methyltransferase [Devosia sp.]